MSVFNETLRRMGGTVSPQLGGGGSSAAPYVPGPMGGITGAQTGISKCLRRPYRTGHTRWAAFSRARKAVCGPARSIGCC